jgi:hypothetical protein
MGAIPLRTEELKRLRYVILPGRLPYNSRQLDLHNQAFQYWSTFWDQVFKENGVEHPVNFRAEFCRRDVVCLLMDDGEIAGMHLCEFLNLRQKAFWHHEYFGQIKGELFLNAAEKFQTESAMIMTYLTIDPRWRKRRIGISMGAVMMSLATKLQVASGAAVNLGRAREDLGVSEILKDLGGTVLEAGISMHNTPVSSICIFTDNIKELSNPGERSFVKFYWDNRTDYSNLTTETQGPTGVAA